MDAAREPGRSLNRDIAQGERVEGELDAFIEGRYIKRVKNEGENREEEEWQAIERRHNGARREEMRAAWCEYHQGQAARHRAVLRALIETHEAAAERLVSL